MPKRTAAKFATPATADVAPTPERQRQGRVERLAQPIADAAGYPAQPYRAVDTLMVIVPGGASTSRCVQRAQKASPRWQNAGWLSAQMLGMVGTEGTARTMNAQ